MEHSLSNDIQDWLTGFHDLNPVADDAEEDTKKVYKLDMFRQTLPAIFARDKKFYRNRTQDEKDELSPWLVMRYMTSVKDSDQPNQLMLVNSLVNHNFSCFSEKKNQGKEGHKELQWMLLTLAHENISKVDKFIKAPKGAVKNKLEEAILKHYPLLSDADLEMLLKINSDSDLEEFFKENGYDDKEIKVLLKSNKGK